MRKTSQDFTLTERLMVVAILVLLAAIAIQNVLVSVESSEEQTVKAARIEYATVRNMYADQNGTPPTVGREQNYTSASAFSNNSDH